MSWGPLVAFRYSLFARSSQLNLSGWDYVSIVRIVPTVLRLLGFRAVIYPNDHSPAHVHVIGHGCEAVFHLNCPKGPVTLRENYWFSRRDIARIKALLGVRVAQLCRDWKKIHAET